jgi:hypothetical protein
MAIDLSKVALIRHGVDIPLFNSLTKNESVKQDLMATDY